MTRPWDRILLARREDASEWSTGFNQKADHFSSYLYFSEVNAEIQRLLRLQHMLPESWIVEVHTKKKT